MAMQQMRVPDGVAGLVEAVRTIGEQDGVLADLLDLLRTVERYVERLQTGEDLGARLAVLLFDVREAVRSGERERQKVAPLVQRLTTCGAVSRPLVDVA